MKNFQIHLERHELSKHLKIRPHHCPICGYSTVQKVNLERHIASKHTENRPFKCALCEQNYIIFIYTYSMI